MIGSAARKVLLLLALGSAVALGCDTSVDALGESKAVQTALLGQQYPVCGTTLVKATGLPWARCASLDTECSRGAWDQTVGCCHLVPRADGTTCAQGVCDLGKCKAPSNPQDRDGDQIPDSNDPVLGKAGWIQAYAASPTYWQDLFSPERAELRLGDAPVAWVPLQSQVDLSKVQLAVAPNPTQRRIVFVSAATPWVEVELDGGQDFEACVANDNLAANAPLPANCTGQNVKRLRCPAKAAGGLECTFEDGRIRVRGPKLRFVWVPIEGNSSDIRLLGLPMQNPIEPCNRCSAIPGHLPAGFKFREICNGIDDDGDGFVDETGANLCDDGLNCTVDACLGTMGCRHTPGIGPRFCSSQLECFELQCGAPLVAGPGEEASATPDANGCYNLRRHDFCNDTFDGCACNGRERCDPFAVPSVPRSAFFASEGCVADTPALDRPCETLNGDADACSIEMCCEDWNPAGCRLHREIQARGEDAEDLYQSICDFAPGESDGDVFCPDEPFKYAPDSYGKQCDDQNPCTTDVCVPPTGTCTHSNLPNGPQPGCSGLTGKGCSTAECSAGFCQFSARPPDTSDPFQCHDFAAVSDPPGMIGTCLRQSCRGASCALVPEPVHCGDGQFCNGAETCSSARLAQQLAEGGRTLSMHASPIPGPLFGCAPAPSAACDDGKACTVDYCNEGTDSCSNQKRDVLCHSLRGLEYDACAPEFRCECSGPECGMPGPDGCSALPAGYEPCDDGNVCTFDTCSCDEFCETATCGHQNFCGMGGQGSGGFGGVGNLGGLGG